ncbi:MAG: serpin family protein, partial [Lachnospiraceae bacterium]|nr:serpin family protein [Lachnospiraceae bacterium]
KADFSPIMDIPDVSLDEAIHAARVKIDEEGVEAAAFTVMMMKNTAVMVPQIIDFTVDRPFHFVMTDQNGVPTFVGTVNNIE